MTKFTDLNLNPKVLKAIEEAGYETPTPIQAGAIPPALEGRDVLGIAQTGTGKTASFTLPMITMLARGRARARMPRSLVLCPTRELAAQVAENFDTYTKHLKLTKALLIGGVSFKEQDQLIDKGVDVLIATPGRLLDHFERGKLLLTGVQIMVVDEADRMLDMGFIPDIERIFSLTPFTRQTLFFSATMAPEIERITNTFLSAPERIEVARQASASETIEQQVVQFKASRKDREASEKRTALRALIDGEGDKLTNAIIFCNRKTDVDIVSKSLKKYGYDAAPIHGDLDQSQRTKTLDGFRDGQLRILVASDVAARGLDVPSVSHVFNYDVPGHPEDYVHRIGRTGRAGREGKAITICSVRDEKALAAVENLLQKEISRMDNPVKKAEPVKRSAAKKPTDTPDQNTENAGGKPTRSRRGATSRKSADAAAPLDAATPQEQGTATQANDDQTGANQTSEDLQAQAPTETGKPEANRSAPRKADSAQSEGRVRTRKAPAKADDKPAVEENAAAQQQSAPKNNRGRGGKQGGRRDDRTVVGMGDHMPSFIALSFAERRAG
ncbi:DEAD/DEAH box helicase [Pseudophaeobacter flagellatus]|uniref:DEAD/DEAH box helicase n=1 Tax=Pseudophaeobacter flagellatus TaxID=2899119 RepID=UPI001E566381|nr:DEAD/DEAH box helicase [Pseudophaeobacter flagellatus]MCD9146451.1 DEAD/DEAH box helicase [Pseudophaeobacter flagellatus]